MRHFIPLLPVDYQLLRSEMVALAPRGGWTIPWSSATGRKGCCC